MRTKKLILFAQCVFVPNGINAIYYTISFSITGSSANIGAISTSSIICLQKGNLKRGFLE